MLYALCEQALGGRSYGNEALDISIRPFQAQDREVLHADTVAQKKCSRRWNKTSPRTG